MRTMKGQIYFDHAATTAVKPEVIAKMLPYFAVDYANPSSVYSISRTARHAVEDSRETIAQC
ncbi:MAG: aminotransferase class V-fold PLP-dependent enzyme, partial [Clostridia bacterium]|nr:aminotransferase class V-fold PLP-dependent enzyme [Clostridia bacterium]